MADKEELQPTPSLIKRIAQVSESYGYKLARVSEEIAKLGAGKEASVPSERRLHHVWSILLEEVNQSWPGLKKSMGDDLGQSGIRHQLIRPLTNRMMEGLMSPALVAASRPPFLALAGNFSRLRAVAEKAENLAFDGPGPDLAGALSAISKQDYAHAAELVRSETDKWAKSVFEKVAGSTKSVVEELGHIGLNQTKFVGELNKAREVIDSGKIKTGLEALGALRDTLFELAPRTIDLAITQLRRTQEFIASETGQSSSNFDQIEAKIRKMGIVGASKAISKIKGPLREYAIKVARMKAGEWDARLDSKCLPAEELGAVRNKLSSLNSALDKQDVELSETCLRELKTDYVGAKTKAIERVDAVLKQAGETLTHLKEQDLDVEKHVLLLDEARKELRNQALGAAYSLVESVIADTRDVGNLSQEADKILGAVSITIASLSEAGQAVDEMLGLHKEAKGKTDAKERLSAAKRVNALVTELLNETVRPIEESCALLHNRIEKLEKEGYETSWATLELRAAEDALKKRLIPQVRKYSASVESWLKKSENDHRQFLDVAKEIRTLITTIEMAGLVPLAYETALDSIRDSEPSQRLQGSIKLRDSARQDLEKSMLFAEEALSSLDKKMSVLPWKDPNATNRRAEIGHLVVEGRFKQAVDECAIESQKIETRIAEQKRLVAELPAQADRLQALAAMGISVGDAPSIIGRLDYSAAPEDLREVQNALNKEEDACLGRLKNEVAALSPSLDGVLEKCDALGVAHLKRPEISSSASIIEFASQAQSLATLLNDVQNRIIARQQRNSLVESLERELSRAEEFNIDADSLYNEALVSLLKDDDDTKVAGTVRDVTEKLHFELSRVQGQSIDSLRSLAAEMESVSQAVSCLWREKELAASILRVGERMPPALLNVFVGVIKSRSARAVSVSSILKREAEMVTAFDTSLATSSSIPGLERIDSLAELEQESALVHERMTELQSIAAIEENVIKSSARIVELIYHALISFGWSEPLRGRRSNAKEFMSSSEPATKRISEINLSLRTGAVRLSQTASFIKEEVRYINLCQVAERAGV